MDENVGVPQKGVKTRKRINDIIPTTDCEGDNGEIGMIKTMKTAKTKEDQRKRGPERSKGLKNDGSGGSSSLNDDSKDEDSSLMSKCKNLTQICKTDGAKGLCDELSKMVKGSLGTKIQKLKENSKIMNKINEIGQSLDKKTSHGHSEFSMSNSPPSRPEPPKATHHRNKSEQKHIKKVDHNNDHDTSMLDKTSDRVKQENIEKWMRNVNSANRKSHQKSQIFDSEDDDEELDDDEEEDEFNEDSRRSQLNDDDEILPRRHHRRLSNINEDSNDNDTIRRNSRNNDPSMKNKNIKSNKQRGDDRYKTSPARPAPPKRPPPPRPSSPESHQEPLRTYKKRDEPKELPASVHDRLMKDMNSKHSQNRVNRRAKSHQSIDSFSAFESPEPARKLRHQQEKPKLPPPPRPPSLPRQRRAKNGDSSGFDSDAIVNTKYSNTLKKNHKSLETMASMVEYEMNVHAESNLKIPQVRGHHNTRNKSQHNNIRSVSPSPEKIIASRERDRTRSKAPASNSRHHSRHHSRQNIAPSLSPVGRQARHNNNNEENTRRKPPIHR